VRACEQRPQGTSRASSPSATEQRSGDGAARSARSDEERQRLYRLRDALGLRDNDAFWSIVIALECDDLHTHREIAKELVICRDRRHGT